MPALVDRTGQRYGRLVVVGRVSQRGESRWLCQCDCGQKKVVRSHNLASGHTKSCGCARATANRARKGERRVNIPTYGSAHGRVRYAFGSASEFACVECGAPADEWAYDHEDENELVGTDHGKLMRYSADPYHYLPMCAPCHREFDRSKR